MIQSQRTPPLDVGDTAPRFTLPASTGQSISLENYLALGPVVLLWYVFDFGRVWTGELQGFRENHSRFVELGAQVLGLSVESSRAHTAFAESLDLPFPLLSDLNREVVRQFGVMYTPERRHREGYYGISKRAVFVLDQAGIVRYGWITDDALVTPDVEEVLGAVARIVRPL